MRVIFAGGGTAGHVNPALAIADAVCRLEKNSDVLFIGTERGLENRLCAEAGYPLWHIDVSGIKRNLSFDNVRAVIKAFKATGVARGFIKKYRPDAVVGTGGYICYPVVKAASDMGIYTVLHESNAIPGMAVKMLKNKVNKIFVNFSECGELLGAGEKTIRSGNPMKNVSADREAIRNELNITGKYRYVLVSFGGSLGAETVNREILKLMESFSSKRSDVFHVHAVGKSGYGDFMKAFTERGLNGCRNISAREYIYDMPKWLTAADLVICRSGAMTLSEIAATGRASILIPSPNVTDNHQYKNAKAFSDAGASYTLCEGSEELKRLPEFVATVLGDKTVREKMEEKARTFDYPGAAEMIAKDIIENAKR